MPSCCGIGGIESTCVYRKHSNTAEYTVMRRLTTGIRSEKRVVGRFRRCANVYLHNLDNVAYHTPRLYGIAYCS